MPGKETEYIMCDLDLQNGVYYIISQTEGFEFLPIYFGL